MINMKLFLCATLLFCKCSAAPNSLRRSLETTVNLPKVSVFMYCESTDVKDHDFTQEMEQYYTDLILSELDAGQNPISSVNGLSVTDMDPCLGGTSRGSVQWSGTLQYSDNVDGALTHDEIMGLVTSDSLKGHMKENVCADISHWNANIQESDQEWDVAKSDGVNVCVDIGDTDSLQTWAIALIVIMVLSCLVGAILCCCCCKIC